MRFLESPRVRIAGAIGLAMSILAILVYLPWVFNLPCSPNGACVGFDPIVTWGGIGGITILLVVSSSLLINSYWNTILRHLNLVRVTTAFTIVAAVFAIFAEFYWIR